MLQERKPRTVQCSVCHNTCSLRDTSYTLLGRQRLSARARPCAGIVSKAAWRRAQDVEVEAQCQRHAHLAQDVVALWRGIVRCAVPAAAGAGRLTAGKKKHMGPTDISYARRCDEFMRAVQPTGQARTGYAMESISGAKKRHANACFAGHESVGPCPLACVPPRIALVVFHRTGWRGQDWP